MKRPSPEASSLPSPPPCPSPRIHLSRSYPSGGHTVQLPLSFSPLSQEFCWDTARDGQLPSPTLGMAQDGGSLGDPPAHEMGSSQPWQGWNGNCHFRTGPQSPAAATKLPVQGHNPPC